MDDLRLLAVHSGDAYELRKLLACSKDKDSYVPDCIIGDMNSGNYSKEDEGEEFRLNRKEFIELSAGYVDLFQGKVTFAGGTQVDHALLKNSAVFFEKYEYENVKVDKEGTTDLSDHYPILFDLRIKNRK